MNEDKPLFEDPALPHDRNQNFSDDVHRAVYAATGRPLGNIKITATAKTRNNFSSMHQRAAERFSIMLNSHENEFDGAGWGSHFEVCMDLGSASIILSFAAIEASMSEALDDLAIGSEIREAIERVPTLTLAQAIIAFVGAKPLQKGSRLMQKANILREVRNGLVHPKAEWSDDLKIHAKLSRQVVQSRAALSPFAPNVMTAFPRGCMSGSFSAWCAATSREFIHEFRTRCSLPSPLPPETN